MNLPRISFTRPTFSPRFFLYFLFGLVILILVAEGGYYYWVQKRTARQQTKNPVIVREEGVFTYVKLPDGSAQKVILGKIKKIDGNLLTIKTDNNKTVQVIFVGESIDINDLSSGIESLSSEIGTIKDLLIGDVVRVSEIYSGDKEEITAKNLGIIRGASE